MRPLPRNTLVVIAAQCADGARVVVEQVWRVRVPVPAHEPGELPLGRALLELLTAIAGHASVSRDVDGALVVDVSAPAPTAGNSRTLFA